MKKLKTRGIIFLLSLLIMFVGFFAMVGLAATGNGNITAWWACSIITIIGIISALISDRPSRIMKHYVAMSVCIHSILYDTANMRGKKYRKCHLLRRRFDSMIDLYQYVCEKYEDAFYDGLSIFGR